MTVNADPRPTAYWFIDSALRLQSVESLPADVSPLHRPEQLLDTILLRNLQSLSQTFLGNSANFLFHSTEYWGPFDIGCLLADGGLGAFETKSKSVDRHGFDKFCRDILTVSQVPNEYVRHRFQHVLTHLDEYIITAERMFAAFFLGVRCDTQPMRRDLIGDASGLLGVDRETLLAEFRRGNGWLEDLRGVTSLEQYAKQLVPGLALHHLAPVLMVPDGCVRRVEQWLLGVEPGKTASAILGSYQFFTAADSLPYPRWLSTTVLREFAVPLVG